jgi:hypothetical protein
LQKEEVEKKDNMGELRKKIPYNRTYYNELRAEGLSHADAVHVASAEMSGAYEKPDGSIDSNQTACPTLEYDENAPKASKEMRDAKRKGMSEAEEAAREAGFASLKNYYRSLGLSTEDLD